MQDFHKNNVQTHTKIIITSIIMFNPPEVCGGVCISRDLPSACIFLFSEYFKLWLRVCSPQLITAQGYDFIKTRLHHSLRSLSSVS